MDTGDRVMWLLIGLGVLVGAVLGVVGDCVLRRVWE